MNLQIHTEGNGDIRKLVLAGEVDAYTAPKLKESLMGLMVQPGLKVVVDLSEVQYMDSTGLGIFVGALKSSQEHNSTLKIAGITDRVQRLFQITGLSDVINIEQTEGEAQ